MPRKRNTAEQIITKLRQAEVETARGQPIAEVCRKPGTSEQTYYRWRREYGGLRVNHLKRLKALELENGRLRTEELLLLSLAIPPVVDGFRFVGD